MFSRYFIGQNLDFRKGRHGGLDFQHGCLDFSRAVSISSRSDKIKVGAKRGAKADSCPKPRTKVKAMPRKTIAEMNVLK